MIPYIRRKKILDELENKDIIYVDELISKLEGISESTVRRDLKTLAKEGQISLLRGGGIKQKTGSFDLPVNTKSLLFTEEKDKIAKYAATIVNDGEAIYIDSGTTPLKMIKYLKNKQISVITTNTQVLNELADTNLTCIIVGGEITKSLASVVGPITDNQLSNMYFDKAFLGASGCSLMSGINTPDVREANKKRIVKTNSKEAYILVDSSKMGKSSFCKVFELDECTIITEKSNEILEHCSEYIIAP